MCFPESIIDIPTRKSVRIDMTLLVNSHKPKDGFDSFLWKVFQFFLWLAHRYNSIDEMTGAGSTRSVGHGNHDGQKRSWCKGEFLRKGGEENVAPQL